MSEYENEPIRGLPGHLPEGEHILWQGAPDWRTLARTGLHAPLVAVYFGVLAFGRIVSGALEGEPATTLLSHASLLMAVGGVAVALLAFYAWLSARTTVYTLTNRRFVLRHGVALTKCFNFPYVLVASAGLKVDGRGVGDIPLALTDDNKVAYPLLWPHVRPFRFSRPEPMMRAVPDAASVARVLGEALAAVAREGGRAFVAGRPEVGPTAVAQPGPVGPAVAA